MPEIQSDPDPQRVSITSSNNTDDSELPLLSLSHDVDVEAPEENKKYSMCRFKSYIHVIHLRCFLLNHVSFLLLYLSMQNNKVFRDSIQSYIYLS